MKRDTRRNIPAYLLCYVLVALIFVLSIVILFIWRVALLEIIRAIDERSYANRAIYMLGIVFMGMALFAVVIGSEPYLRFGVERHQLLRRFWRISIPLVVIAVLGVVLQFVF